MNSGESTLMLRVLGVETLHLNKFALLGGESEKSLSASLLIIIQLDLFRSHPSIVS